MARYTAIEGWPGSVLYTASNGRIYCAAPRGLIPEHPYSIDALRPPNQEERRQWGAGVQPRMVTDVTSLPDLQQRVSRRTLQVAPWNAYLVLRMEEGTIIVVYRFNGEVPRLDKAAAGQVAIASGHDVAGWSSHVITQHGGERWHFSPPHPHHISLPDPVLSRSRP